MSHQLMPRIIELEPVDEDDQINEQALEHATLRRVSLIGDEAVVDNTGRSRYELSIPMREAGLFVIVPVDYS